MTFSLSEVMEIQKDHGQQLRDWTRIIIAMVRSNGGELIVSDKGLLASRPDDLLNVVEDKENRCWRMTVKP